VCAAPMELNPSPSGGHAPRALASVLAHRATRAGHYTCSLSGENLCRLQLNSPTAITHLLPAMKTGLSVFEHDIIPQENALPTMSL